MLGRINEIVNGKRAISADTALRLRQYCKTSPKFRINLQSQYELATTTVKIGKQIKHDIEPFAA